MQLLDPPRSTRNEDISSSSPEQGDSDTRRRSLRLLDAPSALCALQTRGDWSLLSLARLSNWLNSGTAFE